MLKAIIFVDHMNFDISLRSYYHKLGKPCVYLDYSKLFPKIVEQTQIPNTVYVKTYVFIPKPDDFLMQDSKIASFYEWEKGFANFQRVDVVEGRLVSRATSESKEKDIADDSTFYKIEKGTDVNLAVHAVSLAQLNAYDIGIFLSSDTDYIMVYDKLRSFGKIVVQIGLPGQPIGLLREHADECITLDDHFFRTVIYKNKKAAR